MKIFLDTAETDVVRKHFKTGLIDGLTTNPSLIRKSGRKHEEVYQEFKEIGLTDISMEVIGNAENMISEGKRLHKKFEGKNAGFKKWHYEHGSNSEMSQRVLVWAFYLNDAPGTDFMFYPNVSGKEGRCVIFPASFNYIHRSSPNKGIKYIVTGWISYV